MLPRLSSTPASAVAVSSQLVDLYAIIELNNGSCDISATSCRWTNSVFEARQGFAPWHRRFAVNCVKLLHHRAIDNTISQYTIFV